MYHVINPFTIYVSRVPPPNGRHPGRKPSTINPLSNASTPQPPVTLTVRYVPQRNRSTTASSSTVN